MQEEAKETKANDFEEVTNVKVGMSTAAGNALGRLNSFMMPMEQRPFVEFQLAQYYGDLDGDMALEDLLKMTYNQKRFNLLRIHDCQILDTKMPFITDFFKDGSHRLVEIKITEMMIANAADEDCSDQYLPGLI